MSRRFLRVTLGFATTALLVAPLSAPAQTVQDSILTAINESLTAMTAKDVAASLRVMMADGVGYSIRPMPEGLTVRRETHEEYHAGLASNRDTWVERIWAPVVLVHGPIAMVWAPYDFHVNGEFTHCGIDAMTMIRTAAGWQSATWTWSVEPQGCSPGPLGPLTAAAARDPARVRPGTTPAVDNTPPFTADDRAAVVTTVEEFFRGMTANDAAASRRVLIDGGINFATREDPDGLFLRRFTHEDYLEGLRQRTDTVVERMWEPTVLGEGRIAVLWTPYDIYSNGEFLHCGVDAFALLNTEDGWRITSIAFTMERTGCEPSPLGPLQPR